MVVDPSPSPPHKVVRPVRHGVYVAGGLIAASPVLAYCLAGPSMGAQIDALVIGYGLAGLPFFYVMRHWSQLDSSQFELSRLIFWAGAYRLALLCIPPLLSEDVWRYLWDGSVQWAGINPYRYPPMSTQLDFLTSSDSLGFIRHEIGHGDVPTVYPPGAQIFFFLATALGPSLPTFRLALIGMDLVAIWGLWRWAESVGRKPQCAALYAFAPLAMMESAVGAHIDVLGVAALLFFGFSMSTKQNIKAALSLSLSIGVKLMPIMALGALIPHRRVFWLTVALCSVVFFAYWLPGFDTLRGLEVYAHRWRGNDGAFALIYYAFERFWPPGDTPVNLPHIIVWIVRNLVGVSAEGRWHEVWPDELSFAAAKATVGLILGGILLWCILRSKGVMALLGIGISSLVLLSPVVHPWYLLWVVPFAALAIGGSEDRWGWPFLIWSQLIWLAYWPRSTYLETGAWLVPAWTLWMQYLPVWSMLAWSLVKSILDHRRSRDEHHAAQ